MLDSTDSAESYTGVPAPKKKWVNGQLVDDLGDSPPSPSDLPAQPGAEPGLAVIPPPPAFDPTQGGSTSITPPAPDMGMPSSIIPPAPPVPTSQPLTSFGPGNDLQSTQISPAPSERLTGTLGDVTSAQKDVAGFRGFTPYQSVGSGDQSGVKSLLDTAGQDIGGATIDKPAGFGTDTSGVRKQLTDLTSGIGASAPDRKSLALDALKTFDENQANQEKTGIQRIGRANAAAGRLGSGMASTDVGNFEQALAQDRNQMERGLASDVASKSLEDRLAALTGTSGALGQLGGLDLSKGSQDLAAGSTAANLALARGGARAGLAGQEFAQGASGRAETRADQANTLANEEANFGAKTGKLGTLAGIEGQQTGTEAAARGELRGERGYQTDQSRQALEDRIRQKTLEDSLLNSQFNRNAITANAENQAAGQSADQAAGANAGVQNLLSSFALQQFLQQHPELAGAA